MPYRFLTGLAGAAIDAGRLWPARSGRGAVLPRGGLWVHGASVGEIASARVLVEALAERWPVVVTANTPTGVAAAAAMGVAAGLAPIDTPQAVRRFIDRAAPRLAITIENELWPNRSALLAAAGVPQVVVGARLSARSAARWARLRGLIAPMLGRLAAVSAQDAASEARLLALGLPAARLLPRVNLKLLGPARTPLLPEGPYRARTILAASTHAGEEEAVLAAFAALRRAGTGPRLILAPRHPERFDTVAALMTAAGLAPARRSQGADARAPVLLADSMGEMGRWYAEAGICFTGGSLVARGGHTPWEPAAHGCAILHGPDTDNFTEDYARLDAAGAAWPVTAAGLAGTLAGLLDDAPRQRAMGAAARAVLLAEAGDSDALVAMIETFACRCSLPKAPDGSMMQSHPLPDKDR